MKIRICILFSFFSIVIRAQEKFEWVERLSYKIDSLDIWTVDILGNTYISKKELIQKFDSLGRLKFSESEKSFGRLSSIQTINTMKLIVFSEEQQQMCFLDNTLTPFETCIDFEDHYINNATKIAVSSQPDKFWVYDQLNSRLHLLSLQQKNQAQEIENLKGLLNSIQIYSMIEQNNFLYLLDLNQGVYILDMYGSLVNFINRKNIKSFQVDLNYYYLLEGDQVVRIDIETNIEQKFKCPNSGIIDFKKSGNNYYFQTLNEIKKYHLLFDK